MERSLDPAAYGPVFEAAFPDDLCRPLGPGVPDEAAERVLREMDPARAFAHTAVADPQMATLCCAALWLAHDYLDQCHTLCQSVETPSGSFWHGIMHRREGDYSNAKYWFRRTGNHPVFGPLAGAAAALLETTSAARAGACLASGRWDPFALVDLCQAAAGEEGPLADFCRRVQQREWELLFDHCYRQAVNA